MSLEDEVARRLKRAADDFRAGPVPLERILRRGRLRRVRPLVGVLAAAVVLAAGVATPLALLSGIGPRPEDGKPAGSTVTNGLIAFQVLLNRPDYEQPSERRIRQDVYVVGPDGSQPRDFTSDRADYTVPAWSPDGRKLAVVRFERQGQRLDEAIYVMNADGTGLSRVHSTGLPVQSVWQVGWSPDGAQLGFIRVDRPTGGAFSESDEVMQLVVMNADGTDVRALTDRSEQVYSFAWSPDEERIAFTVQYLVTERRFGYDLFVMNADGTGVRRLTDDGRSMDPAWSPDGTRIAFLRWEVAEEIRNRDINVMQADGTVRTRLTADPAAVDHPTWSPDGTKILFARYWANGDCELVVVSPDQEAGASPPVAGPTPATTTGRVLLASDWVGGCPSNPSWQPISAD